MIPSIFCFHIIMSSHYISENIKKKDTHWRGRVYYLKERLGVDWTFPFPNSLTTLFNRLENHHTCVGREIRTYRTLDSLSMKKKFTSSNNWMLLKSCTMNFALTLCCQIWKTMLTLCVFPIAIDGCHPTGIIFGKKRERWCFRIITKIKPFSIVTGVCVCCFGNQLAIIRSASRSYPLCLFLFYLFRLLCVYHRVMKLGVCMNNVVRSSVTPADIQIRQFSVTLRVCV
jgi:hypothetical protein